MQARIIDRNGAVAATFSKRSSAETKMSGSSSRSTRPIGGQREANCIASRVQRIVINAVAACDNTELSSINVFGLAGSEKASAAT